MSHRNIPPILASVIARITAAVPARARTTFLDLLLGTATTKGGHVTDAILTGGLSRGWRTYYWFLEQGRWFFLAAGLGRSARGADDVVPPGGLVRCDR